MYLYSIVDKEDWRHYSPTKPGKANQSAISKEPKRTLKIPKEPKETLWNPKEPKGTQRNTEQLHTVIP